MGVIAKFSVNEVAHNQWSATVKMGAVHPDDSDDRVTRDENQKFWEATPQGKLEIVITNKAAAEQFQPGDDFYVTFERADDAG